jgi:hypothetical protein
MREDIMYAVPHTVTITDRAAALAGLEHMVPQVSGSPGFVAGYWMEHSETEGQAVVIFDSKVAAQGFADLLKTAPDAPGVTPDRASVAVCEVLGHA